MTLTYFIIVFAFLLLIKPEMYIIDSKLLNVFNTYGGVKIFERYEVIYFHNTRY